MIGYVGTKIAHECPKQCALLFVREDRVCAQERMDDIHSKSRDVEDNVIPAKPMNGTAYMREKLACLDLVSRILYCGTNFLKPAQQLSAEYDIYMASALAHAVMEVPSRYQLKILGARDRHSYDQLLIQK